MARTSEEAEPRCEPGQPGSRTHALNLCTMYAASLAQVKTQAQRSQAECPGSHSQLMAERGPEMRSPLPSRAPPPIALSLQVK